VGAPLESNGGFLADFEGSVRVYVLDEVNT